MINRTSPPKIRKNSFLVPNPPSCLLLDNNTKLFSILDHSLDLIHFNIVIKAGQLFEPKKYLASALFNFLKFASSDYPNDKIDQFLDYYGATWNTSVNLENINIQWIIPKSNCTTVLPILLNTLLYPCFPQETFDTFKQQKIKNFEYNSQKYSYRATQLMFSALFTESSPVATLLNTSAIKEITITDLINYHAYTVQSHRINAFVCGNFNEEIKNLMITSFQKFPTHKSPIIFTSFPNEKKTQTLIEEHDNAIQSSVILCKNMFDYNNPDRRDFDFLSTLFGGYFGSRLMQNLRETNGYTYGISNGSTYYGKNSFYYIESDFAVDKTKKAINECFDEMNKLQSDWVTDAEIDTVKQYLEGAVFRNLDGTIAFLKYFSYLNNFKNDENEIPQFLDSLNNISKEKIFSLAKRYLNKDSFSLIVVGNYV